MVGIFSKFSRVVSCLTCLTAAIAAALVGIAAGLATAMGTVVVGTLETAARAYGVKGTVGGNFLAAAFFWLFTICCCKPEHRGRGGDKRNHGDGEKLIPSKGYAPLGNDSHMTGAYGQPYASQPPHYAGRTNLAYEPYSHRT